MLSRRTLVGRLAALTAAVGAAGFARSGSASTRADADSASSEPQFGPPQEIDGRAPEMATATPPWELLHPLAVGSVIHGWRVTELSGVADGAFVLTLRNERGRAHRVHVCRNDGRPHGLMHTRDFDLVVMNGGQGDLPTEEGFAQAVAEMAGVLATNRGAPQANNLLASLLPHGERLRLLSGPVERRLR